MNWLRFFLRSIGTQLNNDTARYRGSSSISQAVVSATFDAPRWACSASRSVGGIAMKKFSVATIPAAAVALGLTMGSGAFAGGHAQCEAYANEAVSLARKISDGGCDTFRGGRLSFNSQEHYVWCMRAGDGDIDTERRTRYDAENSCRTCGSYASEAVQTNSKILDLSVGALGFSGTATTERIYFGA